MEIQLIRHATLRLTYASKQWLVDPMLSEREAMAPIANSANDRRNPLVALPLPLEQVLAGLDALLITHLHRDHFDAAAADRLPKGLPTFCQPEDVERLAGLGFTDLRPVQDGVVWGDVRIDRTGGQHGTGEIGRDMAPVSGFVLAASREGTLYIAGDTIWCDDVAAALDAHDPDVVVVNAGGARFNQGDPITMTPADVARVCEAAPRAQVVAVHMEAINHCLVTRAELRTQLQQVGLAERVQAPADGESVRIPAEGEWLDRQ